MSAFSYDFAHRSLTLIHVPRFLSECGIRAAPILRDAGISPSALSDPEAWFSRDICFALEAEVARVSDFPYFGLQIASHYELAQLGWWGSSIAGAHSLLEAVEFATRTIDTLQRGTQFKVIRTAKALHLNFSYLGRGPLDPLQHTLASLLVLRKIGLLTGERQAVTVKVGRKYVPGFSVLHEYFGPNVVFGCGHDGVVFDSDILDHPLGSTQVDRHAYLETASAVTALIAQLLPHERPTKERIAERLRVSPRTLQRRLDDWGVSFEEMLDDFRRNQAILLLRRRELTALEIAYSLGYSDPAHFTRAFRRWTGMSPHRYRRSGENAVLARALT